MLITKNGISVKVPDDFLDDDYVFGIDRFKRLKKATGLSYEDFAKQYSFTVCELTRWAARNVKHEGYAINNPRPASRVKLAFIEEQLRKERKL